MSASPPEVPNDHKNDSGTNSRREKKVLKKERRPSSAFSSSNAHLARVVMRPEKEKDIKRNTRKSEKKFFC